MEAEVLRPLIKQFAEKLHCDPVLKGRSFEPRRKAAKSAAALAAEASLCAPR